LSGSRFRDKKVLITGGASGVGRAAALLFARSGAEVCVFDIQDEEGNAVVSEIKAGGGEARYLSTDVSRSEAVNASVEALVGDWGRIDVLFNQAGTVIVKPFLETTDLEWLRLMNVNFMSMVFVSRAVIPHMLAAGGGVIVNGASVAGLGATVLESAYCVTKGACVQLTRSIAVEFRDRNIRCNAICPGFIRTKHGLREMEELAALGEPFTEEDVAAMQGRMCTPEEAAQAALFLASEESSFVNGEMLIVDNAASATA
jgi:NAD(P)-dependent dehydrogenase (short-subunit alcohol dehydrogenase family)